MTTAPMYWLRQIEGELDLCKQIPLWGQSPPFPWETLSESLQSQLGSADLTIYPIAYEPLPPQNPLEPFGEHPHVLSFQMSPLPGNLYWIISHESLLAITSALLNLQSPVEPSFQEGFYQYLLLAVSDLIEQMQLYPDMHIQWTEVAPPNPDIPTSFFVDVAIRIQEKVFPARILFSEEFHRAFQHHFQKPIASPFSSPIAQKISILTRLEIGNCTLSQKDWHGLHPGDFLILDRCTYNPDTLKGTGILVWEHTPLFTIKIKKNTLKILDYAAYGGEANTMDENAPIDEESSPEETTEETAEHLWEAPAEEQEQNTQTQESLLTEQIPFPICVEVDRIELSLEKLLQLQPGNVLELTTRPEQGVTLSVHGKKIARGELLKIGEVLGVKILSIGGSTS